MHLEIKNPNKQEAPCRSTDWLPLDSSKTTSCSLLVHRAVRG